MEFTFATVPQLFCAPGAVARAAEFAQRRRLQRVLVVADPGVLKAGLLQPLLDALIAAKLDYALFTGVEPDPGEHVVTAAYTQARDFGAQMVVGLGGGSSLDVAKLAAYFADSSETLRQIVGVEQTKGRRLPLVLIPTTAGTGSEVTPIAIVTLADQTKGGVVSSMLLPDLAILDPNLTLSLPPVVTAHTGVDAMVHAIEAFTSRHRKNVLSDALALRALKLLNDNIRTAFSDGRNAQARQDMLLGACLAGMAFANSPVAAVHALAYPLGGIFHMPHGLSNAVILTEVLRFNRDAALAQYAELGRALTMKSMSDDEAADFLFATLDALLVDLKIDTRLSSYGIRESDLDRLAEDALRQQRLLVNNPRDVTLADARAIYARRLG
ncbi:MAG: iron-containing alcohol dehydrogenase [Gammaproteobacteria bacterium]